MTLAATSVLTACAGVDPTLEASRSVAPVAAARVTDEWAPGETFALRRFDVAQNNRLNKNHWRHANGQSINLDLSLDLASVMARSQHEYTNNGFYHGIVSTYALHVVGPHGPTMQIHSDNKRFNEVVEKAWKKVFEMPDPAGNLSGVDGLTVTAKQVLIAGSSLDVQKATRRSGPTQYGWQTIHPRRLINPAERAGDPLVHMGIEFDRDGRRLRYFIDNPIGPAGVGRSVPNDVKPVPADLVHHIFVHEESEQVTGYPKLASALPIAADLRDYDTEVMHAARNAAKHALGLQAIDPTLVADPELIPGGTCIDVEPGMANVAPWGFQWASLASTQPMAVYEMYRHERLMELGRPLHMPLMLVLLSSSDSNFSSAQFDGTIYAEGVAAFQAMLERQTLRLHVEEVITDLVLAGDVQRPADYTITFSWPKPPHANIEKITKALRTQYEDGAISLMEYCVALGHDYERVQENRKTVMEYLAAEGLPEMPENVGSKQQEQVAGGADSEPAPAKPKREAVA
jgi:capsid protein